MATLPPFLFAARRPSDRRRITRLKAEGQIRPIGPRLYTSLPAAEVSAAAKRAWATIVSELFPSALISHRTALTYLPDDNGVVFLTSNMNRRYTYSGLTVQFIRGPAPLDDDLRFLGMRASSLPRAFLENLMPDARSSLPRTLPIAELERRLEAILRDGGEPELGAIRDRARAIADELGWHAPFQRLDGIIGALLGTRATAHLTSAPALARAIGAPFDTRCFERLQLLFGELRTRALRTLPETFETPQHFEYKAFFEAYFSNYIEGTTFEIAEAEAIVFDKQIPAERPVDAHDIVGTYAVVADRTEMRRTPPSPDDLLELLRARHRTVLGGRPEIQPGVFKTKPNRAGDTHFVLPEYTAGTLRRGYELYADLEPGLQRAVFVMFLISDVHPFNDGNGRIARIMMNAELVAARASTIIIPTVYREDYLNALRALTRRHRAAPLVDALARAHAFSHLDFADYPRVRAELERRNWFREPDDAKLITDPPRSR